jgi:NAD-dependent DNA ligase
MLEEVRASGGLEEFLKRTYDDDPVPMDLLVKYGFLSDVVVSESVGLAGSEIPKDLLEDKSRSIKEVASYHDLWMWMRRMDGRKIVASVKLDGNNVKSLVCERKFECCLTRGRGSNGFDVTEAMNEIFPEKVEVGGRWIVRGECFVLPSALEGLRTKYGEDKFRTSKSAAISLLRRRKDFGREDFGSLKYFVFSCDGLDETVLGTFEKLEGLGFDVPPFVEVDLGLESLEEFEAGVRDLLDELREKQGDLPADGVVFEVNDLGFEAGSDDQYDDRQVAVKFYHWAPSQYRGVVKSVIVEQRRVFCCCKVEIEGIVTNDGCRAETINVFNPSYLIDAGLGIGSAIVFERKSGTVNIMVGGKKLSVSDPNG